MLKRKILAMCALALGLTGCATDAPDVIYLQLATTDVLGLASTDEVTLSDITKGSPNAVGGVIVSYTATTDKGRRFACSTLMMPALGFSRPAYTSFKCKPA